MTKCDPDDVLDVGVLANSVFFVVFCGMRCGVVCVFLAGAILWKRVNASVFCLRFVLLHCAISRQAQHYGQTVAEREFHLPSVNPFAQIVVGCPKL